MHSSAFLELLRLGCIANDGKPEMMRVLLELLDARESDAVRYAAAVQTLELEFATDEPHQVLQKLAGGAGQVASSAAVRLQELEIGIQPSL